MTFLQTLPIKRRLQAVTLMTCAAALAMAFSAMFWFQSVQFRKGFAEELESLAAVIAHNSSATLAFDDKKSAAEVLSALKIKPHITAATIHDSSGKLFAIHGNVNAVLGGELPPAGDGVRFAKGFASLSVRINVADAKPGTLRILADYKTKHRELLGIYTTVLACVGGSALLLIVLISSRLQRSITDPIIRLADMAGVITKEEDYTVRAVSMSNDEVGQLTETFNRMLDQIEARDSELRESQERFEIAVLGSSDGLWDWDIRTNEVYFSPRWKEMIGYEDHELENEYAVWQGLIHPEDAERTLQFLADYLAGKHDTFKVEFRMKCRDGYFKWILSRGVALSDDFGRPVRMAGSHTDISARKLAEAELARLNKELVTASRQAGMAEVAIGVLHNVGNVLNSVNVSATVIGDHLRNSRITNLRRATAMLREQNGNAADYLANDPKGRLLPEYFATVADQLVTEQGEMITESTTLIRHIEHMREIVATQQDYARVGNVTEEVLAQDLVEEAVQISADLYAKDHVEVVRELGRTPALSVDRHKVLQILVNLLKNSKAAMDLQQPKRQKVIIRVGMSADGLVRFAITDNGIGITPENQRKLFQHGFTTKKDGHGFGLHSAANAAKEMGGRMTAFSAGTGTGAAFTLELPAAKDIAKGKGK